MSSSGDNLSSICIILIVVLILSIMTTIYLLQVAINSLSCLLTTITIVFNSTLFISMSFIVKIGLIY